MISADYPSSLKSFSPLSRSVVAATATSVIRACHPLFVIALCLLSPFISLQNSHAQQPGTAAALAGGASVSSLNMPEKHQTRSSEGRTGTISGSVIGEEGRPLANAMINIFSVGEPGKRSRTTATDGEGKFRVDDVEPGAYTVGAYAPGYFLYGGGDHARGGRTRRT